jgi:hypothetical protein
MFMQPPFRCFQVPIFSLAATQPLLTPSPMATLYYSFCPVNRLANERVRAENPLVNVTGSVKIDTQHRAALGRLVKPRERYAAEKPDDGVIVLRRLVVNQSKLPKVKLVRRNGRTLLASDRPVGNEDVQRVMETFP